jgi:hypothetical protein
MANRLLAAERMNWSDMMLALRAAGRVARKLGESSSPGKADVRRGTARYGAKADQSRPEDTRRHTGADIAAMFGLLAGTRHDMVTMAMLAGMKHHWDKHGYLTGAQYDALKALYDRSQTKGRSTWRF